MNIAAIENNNSFSGPLLLFYALLLYIPFQSYLPDTSIGLGINLLNIMLLILIVVCMGIGKQIDNPRYNNFKTIILLFMVYTLASALLNSGYAGIDEAIITWKRFYFIPILFFITYNLLDTEKQIKISIAIMSFITLLSAIQVLRNNLESSSAHYSDGLRYGGMFGPGGENDLAAFLAINFFCFLFWCQESQGIWKKALFLGMAAIVGLACLYCYSRGAYIALTVGLIYYCIRCNRVMLIILIVMLFTIPVWAPQPVRERLEMLTDSEKLEKDNSAQIRIIIWEGAQRMVADNFLYGVGPNNFGANIRKYASLPDNSPSASHNMYLRMAAELGLPGFVFFLMILGYFFKSGFLLSRLASGWQVTWGNAFSASIIALIIVNCFGDRFFREELTGYIWISSAIAYKLKIKKGA